MGLFKNYSMQVRAHNYKGNKVDFLVVSNSVVAISWVSKIILTKIFSQNSNNNLIVNVMDENL